MFYVNIVKLLHDAIVYCERITLVTAKSKSRPNIQLYRIEYWGGQPLRPIGFKPLHEKTGRLRLLSFSVSVIKPQSVRVDNSNSNDGCSYQSALSNCFFARYWGISYRNTHNLDVSQVNNSDWSLYWVKWSEGGHGVAERSRPPNVMNGS